MSRVRQFFSDEYMPPHGFCFLWLPEIVWLHVISDLLIAFSYFSIPVALWYFAKKRPDMPFAKLFLAFATFITLCGITHLFGILVLWKPYYGIEGLVMLATGIVSACTAIIVWRIMPAALTLPSPLKLREINAQLSASNAEIEEKVKRRTQELEAANEELNQARQKAEEANQAKTDFLANISHEIRTPMNVILGLTNIIASTPLTPKQEEYAKTLRTSANSLMSLINDILDISKIEARSLELEAIPFSVYNLVKEMSAIFQFQAEEKNLIFTEYILCEDVEKQVFIGDPNRLRQIMINVCGNALKFTNQGEVRIELSCEKTNDPNVEVITISVKDTGIGIPEDKMNIIFDKFVQADTSTTRKYGGTGLGLSISKSLIESMGGDITVTSTQGNGTCFTITLPLRIAETV